jgi:polysaccharide export outer membrane protein
VKVSLLALVAVLVGAATAVHAQDGAASAAQAGAGAPVAGVATGGPVSGSAAGEPLPDYRIGLGDALSVIFRRAPDMSADVVVRPDGRITLPVINEVDVIGLTTEDLRAKITELGSKYVNEPSVSILVRQINSRYVFITGKINRPGPYTLYGPMSVLQLIAMAGGLRDYADSSHIAVIRTDQSGKQVRQEFNYKRVVNGDDLEQNTTLQPGDTVVVP